MTKKEVIDQIDTVEMELDDLEDIPTKGELDRSHRQLQLQRARLIIALARGVAEGKATPLEVQLLALSVHLADAVQELQIEVAKLKAGRKK